jgi:NAD(P)H-dependent flavin oxidoreductase YrpB (nitropropane dioxygenase family)
MLHTGICNLLKIDLPIVSAGMGGVALSRLAAAVSDAGGFGFIGLAGFSVKAIHHEIAAARELTKKPIGVNLLIPFLRPGVVEAVADEPIAAATFFWGAPADHAGSIRRLQTAGVKVIWQCGSAAEARAAAAAGVDAIMAQGLEAGGHVRGTTTTLALVPEVRDAIGDLPMLAAGGLADGRGLAAVLALGADGAVFGTRFVVARESSAHPDYKRAIIDAHAEDTLHTTLFDIGWPDAHHRVIRTPLVQAWERAGRPATGKRPGEGETAGAMRRPGIEVPLVRYSVFPPTEYIEGDPGGLAFYAGQSCSLVTHALPAGEIVRQIAQEARAVIANRLAPLARE